MGTKHQSLFKSRKVWIRGKVKCNKIPNLRKAQNETIIASICNSGLRGNLFV